MKTKRGELTKIAKATKASAGAICDIFRGRRRPSADLARRLEKATGIPRAAWLWPGEYKNPFIQKGK